MHVLDWFDSWPFESTWDVYQGIGDDWPTLKIRCRTSDFQGRRNRTFHG
jgi:hypothetical protein